MDAKQVVVAFDFSETAEVALERAVDIACREPAHVLHFVAAIDSRKGIGVEPLVPVNFESTEKVEKVILDKVRAAFERRGANGEPIYFVHPRIGHPVEEILDLAKEVGADLIVVGSHGRTGLRRLFLGSVSEAVVRHALCPVMVARPKRYEHVDLEKIVEVQHEPGHRPRHAYRNRSKMSDPVQWPT